MAKVQITDTILRDAHQSQAATRMRLDEMLPACEKLDKVGYFSLECWGGATFDSCLRFLNEDPWDRLRQLRKALPNTKLQMLLRGQNILGYKHYADDVVDYFVKKSIDNGIDIIRVVLVAQQVLAAQQHLQLGLGHVLFDGAQALPRILIQETHADVERRAAPAFYGPITNIVQDGQSRDHILQAHTGSRLGLMGITQDGICNL